MSELRETIRELLLEELARAGKSFPNASSPARRIAEPEQPRDEIVSIHSDADLSRFAARVLALAADPKMAKRIRQGDYPFALVGASVAASSSSEARHVAPGADQHFEKGVVSEKDVAKLSADVGQVTCDATVCLTPLARDALRRRGIKIVRKAP